ncbi:MAG: sulfotransferase, partial [Candidatus Thermoplasmatota archaeon]|nr:sulfotransferase [Candidatus Thermoplasmatota archaeon]
MKDKTWLILKEEPMAGFTLLNILRVLIDNKFKVYPKYWLRFLYALFLSLITFPLRLIEYIRFHRRINNTKIEKDPVFVIGHYRTGTTYLMTLLAKDKSKGYVSNMEGYCPNFFLAFPRLTKWLLDASLPEKRPMDNVIMGAEEPTEEEYSIGAFTKYGYYNGFIFPRNFDLYTRYLTFEDMTKDLEKWKKAYYYFVQKMTLKYNGKQLLLKNPTNSYRIKHLLEMFPNAKFIHTHRNPYEVFLSTMKFFDEVFALYTLQPWDKKKMELDILQNYKLLYQYLDRDLALIPKDRIIHVRYSDFIPSPMDMLEEIYKKLNVEGFEEYKQDFQAYVDSQKQYKPNKHQISDKVIFKVNKYWKEMRENYGYGNLKGTEKK